MKAGVTNDAPWHRILAKEVDFSILPMRPSNQDIELHLQKKKYEKEITTRTRVAALLNSENPDELGEKISQLIESISDNSKNDLIHYVSMRKGNAIPITNGRGLARRARGATFSQAQTLLVCILAKLVYDARTFMAVRIAVENPRIQSPLLGGIMVGMGLERGRKAQ